MTTISNFRSTLAAVPFLSRTSLVLMTASCVVVHFCERFTSVLCFEQRCRTVAFEQAQSFSFRISPSRANRSCVRIADHSVVESGSLSDKRCFPPVRRSASQCCRPVNDDKLTATFCATDICDFGFNGHPDLIPAVNLDAMRIWMAKLPQD